VGGGILRQVCLACGSVTIDLTDAVVDGSGVVANHLES
jgi:hypothetical protein